MHENLVNLAKHLDKTLLIYKLETTGLEENAEILKFEANIILSDGQAFHRQAFFGSENEINEKIYEIAQIEPQRLESKKPFIQNSKGAKQVKSFFEANPVVIGFNLDFHNKILENNLNKANIPTIDCTCPMMDIQNALNHYFREQSGTFKEMMNKLGLEEQNNRFEDLLSLANKAIETVGFDNFKNWSTQSYYPSPTDNAGKDINSAINNGVIFSKETLVAFLEGANLLYKPNSNNQSLMMIKKRKEDRAHIVDMAKFEIQDKTIEEDIVEPEEKPVQNNEKQDIKNEEKPQNLNDKRYKAVQNFLKENKDPIIPLHELYEENKAIFDDMKQLESSVMQYISLEVSTDNFNIFERFTNEQIHQSIAENFSNAIRMLDIEDGELINLDELTEKLEYFTDLSLNEAQVRISMYKLGFELTDDNFMDSALIQDIDFEYTPIPGFEIS